MGENEALTTAAVDQMIAEGNLPSVLLVTGDLSSEGEQASTRVLPNRWRVYRMPALRCS